MKFEQFITESRFQADKLTELGVIKRNIIYQREVDQALFLTREKQSVIMDEQLQIMGHAKPWTPEEAKQAAKRLSWLSTQATEISAESDEIYATYTERIMKTQKEIDSIMEELSIGLRQEEENYEGEEYIKGVRNLVRSLDSYEHDIRAQTDTMNSLDERMRRHIDELSEKVVRVLFKMPKMTPREIDKQFQNIEIWYEIIDNLSKTHRGMMAEYKNDIEEIHAHIDAIMHRLGDESLDTGPEI